MNIPETKNLSTREIYEGYGLIKNMAHLYLLDKYKNICLPLDQIYISYNHPHKKMEILDTTVDDEDYQPDIIDLINQCKHRFTILPITISTGERGITHENILIIDKELKTAERFEPHGDVDFYDDTFDGLLQAYFKTLNIKYIRPLEYCPKINVQLLEEINIDDYKQDEFGYCSAWSVWYVDLRLSNPDVPRHQILEYAINAIKSKGGNSPFYTYIRMYSKKLASLRHKYSKEIIENFRIRNIDNVNEDDTYMTPQKIN